MGVVWVPGLPLMKTTITLFMTDCFIITSNAANKTLFLEINDIINENSYSSGSA